MITKTPACTILTVRSHSYLLTFSNAYNSIFFFDPPPLPKNTFKILTSILTSITTASTFLYFWKAYMTLPAYGLYVFENADNYGWSQNWTTSRSRYWYCVTKHQTGRGLVCHCVTTTLRIHRSRYGNVRPALIPKAFN